MDKEKINAISVAGNIILGVAIIVICEIWGTYAADQNSQIHKYQDRAIQGGLAGRDDTGTFYWLKK